MQFLAKDRIGPLEGGARDGTYVESGEIVDAEIFRAESIPILQEIGVLVEWTAAMEAQRQAELAALADENATEQRAPVLADEPETKKPRATRAKKINGEVEHGTDDSNGD